MSKPKKNIDERIYARLVEQAPLEMWESELKQEGTIVLRNQPIDRKRIVHQEVCGCDLCRRYFPTRTKTSRLIEGATDGD